MPAMRLMVLSMLFVTAGALAQMAPDLGDPEPRIATASFNNGAMQALHPSSGASGSWTDFQLGPGIQVPGAEPGAACRYDLSVQSINYGPGVLSEDEVSKLVVGVRAHLPDGSEAESQGRLCFQGMTLPVQPGAGCTGTETVYLPAGTTELTWTLDPANQVKQTEEDHNFYRLVVTVPSPCTGEVALINSAPSTSASPTPPAKRGIDAARERFSKGLNFTRNVRSSRSGKSPASPSRLAPSSPSNRQPPR